MDYQKSQPGKSEAKGLVILLGLSFITAFAIALFLILNFGPTGSYIGKNTVLSPEALESLNFKDARLATPFKSVFDKIEYSFTQEGKARASIQRIGLDDYEAFYLMVSSDESVDSSRVDPALFAPPAASLSIFIKQEKELKGEASSRVFQRIEIGKDGNSYRVELLGDQETPWAYFIHQGIAEKVTSLFIPK